MAKDPAFLFYPGDYLRDTQTLSEKSQVAYDRIMCEHMRNICISQQQLKFFTKRLNDEEKEELMFTLTKVNGGYQIEWIAESINKRKAYSESRSNNRKKKTVKDVNNISLTYDNHMENENEIVNKEDNTIADFEIFWDQYHKITGKPKTDKEAAIKKWKKLSKQERILAVDKIEPYSKSNDNKEYLKKARTYLEDKNFNDQFETSKKEYRPYD